jgi:hypothetical protein
LLAEQTRVLIGIQDRLPRLAQAKPRIDDEAGS